MAKVIVYIMIHGQNVSFNEIGFNVIYDVTNNIKLDDYTLNELENWEWKEEIDIKQVEAIKDNNEYYIKLKL